MKIAKDRASGLFCGLILAGLLYVPIAAGKKPPKPPPPPPPPVEAVLRMAVVLINFTNDQSQPWTTTQARSMVFDGTDSARAFFLENSFGKQTLAGDVFGWWTVPYDNLTCDTAAWKAAAQQIGESQGVNLHEGVTYDHIALVWPRTNACPYGARAGSFYNGDFRARSVSHELGHAFGLAHANKYECRDASGQLVPLSTNCMSVEYGDLYDIMGGGPWHFNGWEKAHNGWLTGHVITASGRYTVAPVGWQPQSYPQHLLIRRADGSVFALDFRQPFGQYDQWPSDYDSVLGVSVRVVAKMPWETPAESAPTNSVDADVADSNWNTTFKPGQTLTDPLGGVTITVASVSPSGAVVDVGVS